MSLVVSKILNYIKPYNTIILICFLLLIFGAIAYSVYIKSNLKHVKFKDVANANQNADRIEFYYFAADWCPHCKTALPEWENFKKQFNNKEVNGYITKCVDVDCTDENSKVQNMISKYDIESYPTVKMVKDKNITNVFFHDAVPKDEVGVFLSKMDALYIGWHFSKIYRFGISANKLFDYLY